MSRLVYACRFDVLRNVGLDPILGKYQNWVERHYAKNFNLPKFQFKVGQKFESPTTLPQKHHLSGDVFSNDDGIVHHLKWSYPSETDEFLLWRNDIRLAQFSERLGTEHTISLESIDFFVAPARIEMGSPRIIRDICGEQSVFVGEMQIQAAPYNLDVDGIEQFVVLLTSPLRRLPIVFLTPYASGGENELDATRLARELAGVAIIVAARSAEVTWDISDRLGRSLSCFDGASRIYWPGFSVDDMPRKHPLYLSSNVARLGSASTAQAIQQTIFSVATFRFVSDTRMNTIVRAVENAKRLERMDERRAESGTNWEQYAIELDENLTTTKNRLLELEAENENLKANQSIVFSIETKDEQNDRQLREPTSNREAVEFAKVDFDNLVVLDSAIDAATNCPFRRPQEIYDALGDLADIARHSIEQMQVGKTGGDLRQNLIAKGWGKRCSMAISNTTKRKYKDSYTFEYNGEKKLYEPHITLGSGDPNMCASIHFLPDQGSGKMVIAHVGRHLPNTKT